VTYNVSSKSNPQCFGPSCGLKYLTNDPIFSDPLHELDSDIAKFRHVVATFPRTSPLRIGCIKALASALAQRYILLRQVDDLEQSILHYTEAIFLPPHWDRHFPNITYDLLLTAQHLLLRAVHTEHPEDVERPVIYLRYLCGQSLEAFNVPLDMVKEHLVCALAQQVRLELGDVMQDIEEMTTLILELLNSDTRTISTRAITSFAEVIGTRHGRWTKGKAPPTKVIDCLRKAIIRQPDSDELPITLACTLLDRFRIAYSNDDYEEGTAVLDEFLLFHAPGVQSSQYQKALQIIDYLRFCTGPIERVLEAGAFRGGDLPHSELPPLDFS